MMLCLCVCRSRKVLLLLLFIASISLLPSGFFFHRVGPEKAHCSLLHCFFLSASFSLLPFHCFFFIASFSNKQSTTEHNLGLIKQDLQKIQHPVLHAWHLKQWLKTVITRCEAATRGHYLWF